MELDRIASDVRQDNRMATISVLAVEYEWVDAAEQHIAFTKEASDILKRCRSIHKSDASLTYYRAREFLFPLDIRKFSLGLKNIFPPDLMEISPSVAGEGFIPKPAPDINDYKTSLRKIEHPGAVPRPFPLCVRG